MSNKRTMLFSATNVHELVNPAEWLWDEEQPYLALRRGRTWYCRVPGKRGQKPYPIGTTAELDPSDARIKVREHRRDALKGINTRAEEAEKVAKVANARTLAQAADAYLARIKDGGKIGAKQYSTHERYLTGEYFRPLHDRPLERIERENVTDRLDYIRETGIEGGKASKNAASGARGSLDMLFKYAIAQGWAEKNPVDGTINPAPRKDAVERQRVLTDDELATVWKATSDATDAYRVIRLLILLGNRLEEVVGMKWSELKAGVWTIPVEDGRNKNRTVRRLPLPAAALEILEATPKVESRDRVFDVTSRNVRRVASLLGVPGWRLHDLRRTMRTGLTRLGILDEIAELCIGHKREKLVRTYSVDDRLAEQAMAFGRWANKVTGAEPPDNVVELSRAA